MGLTVTGVELDGNLTNVRADGERITAIGTEVVAEPCAVGIDGAGRPMVGGLINGHGHAAMTLFRGFGSDLRLLDWLEKMIWPAEARLTDDDVYWGTRLAALEMIRSGTTHFYDM